MSFVAVVLGLFAAIHAGKAAYKGSQCRANFQEVSCPNAAALLGEQIFALVLALLAIALVIGATLLRPWLPVQRPEPRQFTRQTPTSAPVGYSPQGWQPGSQAGGQAAYGQQAGGQHPQGDRPAESLRPFRTIRVKRSQDCVKTAQKRDSLPVVWA